MLADQTAVVVSQHLHQSSVSEMNPVLPSLPFVFLISPFSCVFLDNMAGHISPYVVKTKGGAAHPAIYVTITSFGFFILNAWMLYTCLEMGEVMEWQYASSYNMKV
jgi:hypothetical protein